MTVEEFRKKAKANARLSVEGRDFVIEEVIKFRFDDGTFYIKCILNDGYVFADDAVNNMFLLVKEIKTSFSQPFGEELNFNGKKFDFLFEAHAVAEEILGKEIWPKGYAERFWDFQANDGSYLSLGVDDATRKRMDFYGKIIGPESVEIHA